MRLFPYEGRRGLPFLECIRRIEDGRAARRVGFMASHTLQDAVLRNLQVLAESTQRLSAPLRGERPEIYWRRVAAFGNVLPHDYLAVDMDAIWEIVPRDIPALKQAVSRMLHL